LQDKIRAGGCWKKHSRQVSAVSADSESGRCWGDTLHSGGNAIKSCSPAGFSGGVRCGCQSVPRKNRTIAVGSGSVSLENDAGQARAALERSAADACDAAGNGHAGQARAAIERRTADVGDATGDSVAASYADRTLDEHGLALVEQDPTSTTVNGIVCVHQDVA